jgi:hypothetical protein
MRNMTRQPTLEELAAELDAQNTELADMARLAESISDDFRISESALRAFDDLTEPPASGGGHLLCVGIRA